MRKDAVSLCLLKGALHQYVPSTILNVLHQHLSKLSYYSWVIYLHVRIFHLFPCAYTKFFFLEAKFVARDWRGFGLGGRRMDLMGGKCDYSA